MRDFLILIIGIYIFATSFFAAKYLIEPPQAPLTTPIRQLVLPDIKHKIVLKSGDIIQTKLLSTNKTRITATDSSGLQTTFLKSEIDSIDDIPSEKFDKRIFVLGSITKKKLSHIEELLFFSDVMWVFWFIGIYWVSMKKRFLAWQCWLIASFFCLCQSFLTTWLIGKSPGAILVAAPNISTTLNHFLPKQNDIFFWGIQIVILAVLPTTLFFSFGKLVMKRKVIKLRKQNSL